MDRGETRKKYAAILFCTALSAVVMAICAMSSPLYPMNTWVDVNCFHTVGRALLQGKVLYRDIYEQKGPLLYFIYAFLASATPRSFLSVYLMETACFSAYLYCGGKCAALYTEKSWPVYAIAPPLAAAICTSDAFALGASAEELCLFPAAASVYMLLRAMRKRAPVPGRDAFLIGLFASAALWIKFTLCGLYAGLALAVALYYWRGLRQPRRLPGVIGWFLLGLVPITAAVLAYFAANGAVADLFWAYFYNNIFLYASTGGNILAALRSIVWRVYVTLWHNRAYMGMTALGALWLLAGGRARRWESVTVCLGCGCAAASVFAGGVLRVLRTVFRRVLHIWPGGAGAGVAVGERERQDPVSGRCESGARRGAVCGAACRIAGVCI